MNLQKWNISSTFIFYHLFCWFYFSYFKQEQQPAHFHFGLVSVSTSEHFSFPQNKAFPKLQGLWLATTWNGKGWAAKGTRNSWKPLKRAIGHKNMRNKSKNMTNAWYPVSQIFWQFWVVFSWVTALKIYVHSLP